MNTDTAARKIVAARGPRFAVEGQIRPGERQVSYADTAERAEEIRAQFEANSYYRIIINEPAADLDFQAIGREFTNARRTADEAKQVARAAAYRMVERGVAETEIAHTFTVDRMTVRNWLGK